MLIELRFEISARDRHRVLIEQSLDARDETGLERALEAVGRAARSYAVNDKEPRPSGRGEG